MGTVTGTYATGTFSSGCTSTVLQATNLDTYVGRAIAITGGSGIGQMRYLISSGGSNQATVSEALDTVPASGDAWAIGKDFADVSSDEGNKFKLVLKRVDDWTTSEALTIGDGGTTLTFVSWYDGTVELDSTLTISGAYFMFGFKIDQQPSGGGALFGANTLTAGSTMLSISSGSYADLFDLANRATYRNKIAIASTDVRMKKTSWFNCVGEFEVSGAAAVEDIGLTGKGNSTEFLEIDDDSTLDGVLLVNTYGLIPYGTGETISVSNYQGANVTYDCEVKSNTIWKFINPTWEGGDPTILWTQTSASYYVEELFDLDLTVATAAGSGLQYAVTVLYEDSTDALVNLQTADANGQTSDDALARKWTNTGSGEVETQYGPWTLRVWLYGYLPFDGAQAVTAAIDRPVTLLSDSAISLSEAAADAITGVVVEEQSTNSATVLKYDAGTIDFEVDDVVDGGTSGAQGTVVSVEGDTTSGIIVLDTRNGTAFQDNEDLEVSAVKQAEADGTGYNYWWLIDCGSNSLSNTYHYLASKMAKSSSPPAWVANARKRFVQMLKESGGDYYTERNVGDTEGIFPYNRGTGASTNGFEDDAGNTYVPPTSVTLTINVKDKNGSGINGAWCYIQDVTGPFNNTEHIMREQTASGQATEPYSYSGDLSVIVKVRKDGYVDYASTQTIRSSGLTLDVRMQDETVS